MCSQCVALVHWLWQPQRQRLHGEAVETGGHTSFVFRYAFEGDGEARDLEIVGSKLDLELTYLADILRLDVTTESVVLFEFRPLAFI